MPPRIIVTWITACLLFCVHGAVVAFGRQKEKAGVRQVFIIQSTCTPVNDNLMELLLMVSALKRASAAKVAARLVVSCRSLA